MKAVVASESNLWLLFRPILLILLAILIGFIIVDLASGAAPMPPAEPPTVTIVSPWNGAFYASEYEGGRPFVSVGSKVSPHSVVCIVEAMKQFRVYAGVEGTITEVLVANNAMVVPGQPLFKVKLTQPEMPPK